MEMIIESKKSIWKIDIKCRRSGVNYVKNIQYC